MNSVAGGGKHWSDVGETTRWSVTTLAMTLSSTACAVANPAFGADETALTDATSDTEGGADAADAMPEEDSSGADNSVDAEGDDDAADGGTDDDAMPSPICGDGIRDPGEVCDAVAADNEVGCTADCTRLGELQWSNILEVNRPSHARYHDVAVSGSRVYAVGAADIAGTPEPDAVVGRYDAQTGQELGLDLADANAESGEARSVLALDDGLFIGGTLVHDGNSTAAVIKLDATTLAPQWTSVDFGGTACDGITIAGGDIAAVFDVNAGDGYGRAEIDIESGSVESAWEQTGAPRGFESIATLEPLWFAAGFDSGHAVVQEISKDSAEDNAQVFTGTGDLASGDNGFRSIAHHQGDLIVAGFQTNAATMRDAWVVRVTPGGGSQWEWAGSPAGPDSDEIEAAVADGDGRIIAVGVAHTPEVPKLWVLDATDGTLHSTRTYPELGAGMDARFVGVVVDASAKAAYVVGTRRAAQDQQSVGFVTRLSL